VTGGIASNEATQRKPPANAMLSFDQKLNAWHRILDAPDLPGR
jgi:hypothetical protein